MTAVRLVKQKGVHHLIAAYDGFESEKQLVVVGSGDEYPGSYADAVHRQGEGNSSVIFLGFQTGSALRQLFANCYVYIHPSEAEGLSVSILEAMAAERCVLVSDIPENVESIDHSGISFVNASPEDLRVKIRQLINHPKIVDELGKKGKRWVEKEYNWDRIAELTENYFARILSEPK